VLPDAVLYNTLTHPPRRSAHRSICPDDWTEKWEEERPAGLFAGIQWPIVERPFLAHKFPNGDPDLKK
jgi:hypothetical protein